MFMKVILLQSNPYPQALNTLTVTIELSHVLSSQAGAQVYLHPVLEAGILLTWLFLIGFKINITGLIYYSRPTGVYFLGGGKNM